MSYERFYGDAKATARRGDEGRKQKAFKALREQYESDPTPENQMKLAGALFDIGRFAEAERLLKDLLTTQSDNLQLLFDLAFIYKNLDRLEDAKQTFKQIIANNPRHALARSAEHELWTLDPEFKPSWLRK